MKSFGRPVWVLLVAGLALRCVALTQPIVDNGILRQAQTAAFTQSLLQTPGFVLSARIPWVGDLSVRDWRSQEISFNGRDTESFDL